MEAIVYKNNIKLFVDNQNYKVGKEWIDGLMDHLYGWMDGWIDQCINGWLYLSMH